MSAGASTRLRCERLSWDVRVKMETWECRRSCLALTRHAKQRAQNLSIQGAIGEEQDRSAVVKRMSSPSSGQSISRS